ncbi:MAG: hypothetical protein QHC78_16495 [Pigmentiphaga sp.]|uniref:hypothetical protein n=1 Tax=Pigmentiphaga sp. TaxID=1977564 RepID=UPI0029B2DD54|nr:hypothetical protein [Pigmentiphaga sp.]MDX3907291.1 hypothetical protein [Pigmentiphaga sp.]
MSDTKPAESGRLGQPDTGAHAKKQGDKLRSRSADPGQSSYGGFKGEDSRRQVQDLGDDKPKDQR